MANSNQLVHKVEVNLSAQDRRRIDRITKAVEALVKQDRPMVNYYNSSASATQEALRQAFRKAREVSRDARSGQFVSHEEAQANPDTTVTEKIVDQTTHSEDTLFKFAEALEAAGITGSTTRENIIGEVLNRGLLIRERL